MAHAHRKGGGIGVCRLSVVYWRRGHCAMRVCTLKAQDVTLPYRSPFICPVSCVLLGHAHWIQEVNRQVEKTCFPTSAHSYMCFFFFTGLNNGGDIVVRLQDMEMMGPILHRIQSSTNHKVCLLVSDWYTCPFSCSEPTLLKCAHLTIHERFGL